MALVNVKLINGVFTQAQKQEMIRKLTDAMVSIEGENLRQVTWVVIEEVESGHWGVGGNCLTTSDVIAQATGNEMRLVAGIGGDSQTHSHICSLLSVKGDLLRFHHRP